MDMRPKARVVEEHAAKACLHDPGTFRVWILDLGPPLLCSEAVHETKKLTSAKHAVHVATDNPTFKARQSL